MMQKSFCGCQCFFTKNYHLADYNIHVEYFNDKKRFLDTYEKELAKRGCSGEKQIETALATLHNEFVRRESLVSRSLKRKTSIRASYVPLHEEVYKLKESYFQEKFLTIVKYAKEVEADYETMVSLMHKEKPQKVYRLPVFKKEFCKLFLEELANFERSDLPKARPNTMNNRGILLGELGFDEDFLSPLREHYLNPLSRVIFPEWGGGSLDSHRAFTVKYSEAEDVDLGFHYDNAEVTLNVSLDEEFEDGSLYFGLMRQESQSEEKYVEVKHSLGEGIFHRGQHKHGALPITFGERTNLIIWMRSSEIRNKLCPMCDNEPSLVSMPGFGDGFTREQVQVCNLY